MKNLSIRMKVTLWFILFLSLILGLTYVLSFLSGQAVSRSQVQSELQEIIDNNIDDAAFYPRGEEPRLSGGDEQIRFRDGILEIDDSFPKLRNGVGAGIYTPDGEKIYGNDLIPGESGNIPFEDGHLEVIRSGPDVFYVYDRKMEVDKAGELWLRGAVDRDQRQEDTWELFRNSLFLLPFLILLAAAGGYLITRRELLPIRRLTEAAGNISSGSDLKQRIDVGEGENEVQQLTRSFNDMMQRLDSSFEAEKQFTSDVSHELRTPMATILAQCEIALEEDELTEQEAREALQVIRRQGDRMSELIEDMLVYTRLGRHHDRYPFEEVDLSSLTRDICEDFSAEASIRTRIEEGIVLPGSGLLLERLLTNLLENAVRYGKEDPQIRVELSRENGECLLRVADRGIGIGPEHLDRIFDRFYQADPARTGEGTGLGLAMVKEIAAIHGGTVAVESRLGEGSTFTVRIPNS